MTDFCQLLLIKQTGSWQLTTGLINKRPVYAHPEDHSGCGVARGGKIIFVRTPSSGPFFMGESMGYPRAKYWDRLLAETNCEGFHFTDYPAIANLQCPEFSHLSQQQAILFTKTFVEAIQQKKGWEFLKTTHP